MHPCRSVAATVAFYGRLDFEGGAHKADARYGMDALEHTPWGMREFAVVDPAGNLLRIGQVVGR